MEPHLLFLAGLPYKVDRAFQFYMSYFTPQGKKVITNNTGGGTTSSDIIKVLSKYKDLTNLAKGKELFLTYLKRPKKGEKPEQYNELYNKYPGEATEVEESLAQHSNWFKSDGSVNEQFGYKVLSYNAEHIYDKIHGVNAYRKVINPKIEKMVKQVILAVKDDIECVNESNKCYHYLAFDIMLDENHHPWLLEVNVNPGLQAPKSKIVPGGIGRFMNNIFNYTLNDGASLVTMEFKPKEHKTLTKDKSFWELIESIDDYPEENEEGKYERKEIIQTIDGKKIKQKWIKIPYKEGDIVTYRYSKEPGGPLYDKNGKYRKGSETWKNTKDSDWVKGSPKPDGKSGELNGKYYVPVKLRGKTKEEILNNKKYVNMLVKSKVYPKSLFHEILTLSNSKNLKSMQQIGSILFVNNSMSSSKSKSKKKEKEPVVNEVDKWIAKVLKDAGFLGIEKDSGGTMYVPPQLAFVFAQAKEALMGDDDDSGKKTAEEQFKKYMQLILKNQMIQSMFRGGGRRSLMSPLFKPGLQVMPAYLNEMFKPFFKGHFGFRGGNMMNHLMQLYMFQEIFDTKDKDGNFLQFAMLGPQDYFNVKMMEAFFNNKKSDFGVNIMGVDLKPEQVFVALADAGSPGVYPFHPNNNFYRGNSLWGNIYGWDDYGIPILPYPDPSFDYCFNIKGSNVRGYSGRCRIEDGQNPLTCKDGPLRTALRRMGIPKELINKCKNKDQLECLLGVYGVSGIIDFSFPFASGHPSSNTSLMNMYSMMVQSGITSNPFNYLKDALKGKIKDDTYNIMLGMLNPGVGDAFYRINLPGGGFWDPNIVGVPGMEGMLMMNAFKDQ